MADARRLVEGVVKLVSLPEVFVRLDAMIRDPYCNLADVADIIADDPGMSARLLRIANSAMFNFPSPIDSIQRAITVIGTKQLRDLVLATSVIEVFNKIPQTHVNMESFWRHSLGTGIMARTLATCRREPNVEHFYVAGLLHDIGRMVMYMAIPHKANEAIERCLAQHKLLHVAERELLGFDHADVGAELISAWQLPGALTEAIRYHHAPSRASEYPDDAAITHVADIVANALVKGTSGEHLIPTLDNQAWSRLDIEVARLRELVSFAEHQYADVVDFFLGKEAA